MSTQRVKLDRQLARHFIRSLEGRGYTIAKPGETIKRKQFRPNVSDSLVVVEFWQPSEGGFGAKLGPERPEYGPWVRRNAAAR